MDFLAKRLLLELIHQSNVGQMDFVGRAIVDNYLDSDAFTFFDAKHHACLCAWPTLQEIPRERRGGKYRCIYGEPLRDFQFRPPRLRDAKA